MPEFETKDSGERAQFDSGMQRDTEAGKPRFDLMLPLNVPYEEQMITRLAALFGRGSVKYDARNWEQADSQDELDRMKSSAFRHFMQWMAGETDEDHAAAVMFNLIAWESTSYKIDRAIDGLQPHEVEAVAQIIADVRAGEGRPTVTPEDMSRDYDPASPSEPAPSSDGSDCELVAKSGCKWSVSYFACPVTVADGCVAGKHHAPL